MESEFPEESQYVFETKQTRLDTLNQLKNHKSNCAINPNSPVNPRPGAYQHSYQLISDKGDDDPTFLFLGSRQDKMVRDGKLLKFFGNDDIEKNRISISDHQLMYKSGEGDDDNPVVYTILSRDKIREDCTGNVYRRINVEPQNLDKYLNKVGEEYYDH